MDYRRQNSLHSVCQHIGGDFIINVQKRDRFPVFHPIQTVGGGGGGAFDATPT